MAQGPIRLTTPIMEEDHLTSSLSEKTNFSRPLMANESIQDPQGICVLKGY